MPSWSVRHRLYPALSSDKVHMLFKFGRSIGYNALLNFFNLNPELGASAHVFYLIAPTESINIVGQCIITEYMRNAKTALYIRVRLDSRQIFLIVSSVKLIYLSK